MKNLKKFGELNEEITEGPERTNQKFVDSPRPTVEPVPQNSVGVQSTEVITYTEEEVITMLQGLSAEVIYNFDDYGRGFEFATKQGNIEGQKYFDEHKK